MQARGAQLKGAPDKARSEKIGSLSFEDQQKVASGKGKNADAAQKALGQKLSELSNKRNLSAKEYGQLASLTGSEGIAGGGTPNPVFDGSHQQQNTGIYSNPLYSGGGGGGATPSPVTAPQPAPGGGGTNPNVGANMRAANRRGQGASNWSGGSGTPPNPTPPTNPPLGPPPPPPGGSSTP